MEENMKFRLTRTQYPFMSEEKQEKIKKLDKLFNSTISFKLFINVEKRYMQLIFLISFIRIVSGLSFIHPSLNVPFPDLWEIASVFLIIRTTLHLDTNIGRNKFFTFFMKVGTLTILSSYFYHLVVIGLPTIGLPYALTSLEGLISILLVAGVFKVCMKINSAIFAFYGGTL